LHCFDPCSSYAAIFAPTDDRFATAITFKTLFDLDVGMLLPSLPATNAKRLRKGAKATKQSIYARAERWIASLRSQ
jgi:hypothetical protein